MARFFVAVAVILACGMVTSNAFGSPKGFFIGGGLAGRTSSGDLDGKSFLVSTAGNREGSVGKLDDGNGLLFDIGYNFGKHFGLEYLESHTVHNAKHQLEPSATDAVVSTGLAGFRLSAGLADHFDIFARIGFAFASVTYQRYGHKGSFSPAFTSTSDEDFSLSGGGSGYGVGAEALFGQHLGIGIGYTVYAITFDRGNIAGTTVSIDSNQPTATFNTTDVTVLWHF